MDGKPGPWHMGCNFLHLTLSRPSFLKVCSGDMLYSNESTGLTTPGREGFFMKDMTTKVTPDGSIVIPPSMQQALDLHTGDDIVLRLEDGELRILTMKQVLRKAQELVSHYVSSERSLAEELIAERREEGRK